MTLNSRTNNAKTVSNLVVNGIVRLVSRRSTPWVGTMTQLNNALTASLGNSVPAFWPGSASVLRVVLNRVVRRVRAEGISVRFTRTSDNTRTRLVEFSVR